MAVVTSVTYLDGVFPPLSAAGQTITCTVGGVLYASYNGGAYAAVSGAGSIPVATSTAAGLMSTLAAPLNVSLPVIAFQSAVLDLTQTQTVQMGVAVAGFYASAFTARLIITSGAGSCTTGPTFTMGNNVAKTNLCLSSAISTTNINAAIAAGGGIMSGLIPTNASSLAYVDLTTPVSGVITVAAAGTGGFALGGRLQTVFVLSAMPA